MSKLEQEEFELVVSNCIHRRVTANNYKDKCGDEINQTNEQKLPVEFSIACDS